MRGVDLEVDRLSVDALVASSYPGRLVLNLPLDLTKVVELATRDVTKLGPFVLTSYTSWRMRYVNLITLGLVFSVTRDVDELQDQRSSCDNATSTRQKVPANNVLKY